MDFTHNINIVAYRIEGNVYKDTHTTKCTQFLKTATQVSFYFVQKIAITKSTMEIDRLAVTLV